MDSVPSASTTKPNDKNRLELHKLETEKKTLNEIRNLIEEELRCLKVSGYELDLLIDWLIIFWLFLQHEQECARQALQDLTQPTSNITVVNDDQSAAAESESFLMDSDPDI